MNHIIQFAAEGTGIFAAAIGAIWFLLRTVLQKALDQHFARLSAMLDKQMGLYNKAAEFRLEQELSVYPALSQLIYRAKTGADKALNARTIFDINNPDLNESCNKLTSKLHDYRIYVTEEIWADLHEYKHLLQDLVRLGDEATRDDIAQSDTNISHTTKEMISQRHRKLSALCDQIINDIRLHLARLEGPLTGRIQK